MNRSESKYFHTARRMQEALLTLLEQKDFAYITVTEVCRLAGVNRSTFYLHYETTADLLAECVEDMTGQFLQCFQKTPAAFRGSIHTAPLEQLFLITPDYLIPYLTYIAQHRTVFKVVLDKPELMQAEKTYTALFGDILDSILERHRVPEADRGYMLSFYIAGVMGIVKRWLLADCAEPVEEIARIIMLVIRR